MPSMRALERLAAAWPAAPPPPQPSLAAAAALEESPLPLSSSSASASASSSSSSASVAPTKPAAASAWSGSGASHVYLLRDFPGREAAALGGAFRDNVRWLLKQWGPAAGGGGGSSAWRALLSDNRVGAVVPIVAVEELTSASPAPLCDSCRCAGWSHHWVSKRKYHFIIPAAAHWDQELTADVLLGRNDNILHGFIHSNGFGHLIMLRGRDGGSTLLSGCDIMDIWDRLCSALRVRAVSTVDFSRKRSLDLRLLLGVAHGETWFTRWGFNLARGCFSVSTSTYASALETLASLPIDYLRSRHVRRVVNTYRRLSNKPLATVREFLHCLLDWKHREQPHSPPPANSCPKLPFMLPKLSMMKRLKQPHQRFEDVVDVLQCRWTKTRLLSAAEVVVDRLLEYGNGAEMTRQEVRDAARGAIGDTGLLDFVIKSLGDTIVGRYIVRRLPHAETRVLHFSLEEYDEPAPANAEVERTPPVVRWPSTADVERDLRAVYRAMVEARSEAAQAVLDCKHWVKWWGLGDEADDQLRFLVEWRPQSWEATELTRPMPPGEIVVVPLHTSIGELLIKVENVLRDTYCFFEEFRAEALDGIDGEKWDPVMLGGAESGDTIGVHGHGVDMETELRYQGGLDVWEVRCVCGAQDDDGERMVACDTCDVWNHTRCVGIADSEPVPPLFLCVLCGGALMAAGPLIDETLTLPEAK